MDISDFTKLLGALQSTNNDERAQAEKVYDEINSKDRLLLLIETLTNPGANDETKSLIAVLLRRLLLNSYEECFVPLPEETKAMIKMRLLQCVYELTMASVDQVNFASGSSLQRKVADATAELAHEIIDSETPEAWPEFIKFLTDAVKSDNSALKTVALHMFATIPNAFGEPDLSEAGIVAKNTAFSMFATVLNDSVIQVRLAAAKALCQYVVTHEDDEKIFADFKEFVPKLLQAVVEGIQLDGSDDTLLKLLVDIADSSAYKFLRPYLSHVIEMCMRIILASTSEQALGLQVEENVMHLALEVIVSLAEQLPAPIRKLSKSSGATSNFLNILIIHILNMMSDLDDDSDWAVQDEVEDSDEMSNSATGETSLDRLACKLGGKTMLPLLLNNILPLLKQENWKARHAALLAIGTCGEGCQKEFEGMLGKILETILPFLQDPHPRVRYAACNAVGQMSTDFGPLLQKQYHTQVVPGLLAVLDDFANPRVQAHAGAALVNFSESCPKTVLATYLDQLLSKLNDILTKKLNELVQKGTKLVLEQVVTTLASIADTAEERFADFYDHFMPPLKLIMEHAIQPELKLLRGKTIECISLIGLAVGRDRFLGDAASVMELLLKTQQEHEAKDTNKENVQNNGDVVDDDDPQMTYMISAWARMCKIMGRDFEPYLPLVMGPVLKTAQIKPEICIMDNDEAAETQDGGGDNWQVVKLGEDQNFGIKTSRLEDKATACQMLTCYARELKEKFAPYVEQVAKIMVPLLKFYFHDEVREAASEIMPFLLDSARVQGDAFAVQLWYYIAPALLRAIVGEPESENLAKHLSSLASCISKMGAGCLDASMPPVEDARSGENQGTTPTDEDANKTMLTLLGEQLERLLNTHFEKHDERVKKRLNDEDYDEDEEEQLLNEKDEDEYLLSCVSDVIHSLFLTHKNRILPFFHRFIPHCVKLVDQSRPWSDLQWGLCMWDDVLEHTPAESWQYHEVIMPAMTRALMHSEPDVRQAAGYGFGVLAMFCGDEWNEFLAQALPFLVQIVSHADSRSEVNLLATENSLSAITKIMKYKPGVVGASGPTAMSQLQSTWLRWLPAWEDKEETEHIYNYLCDLIEGNSVEILGTDNANIPCIVGIIAECLRHEGLSPKDSAYQRCLNVVRLVQSNSQVFEVCLQQLTVEQKSCLEKALST